MDDDLALALRLADLADHVTLAGWAPTGVTAQTKADGSPVTVVDIAAEEALAAELERLGSGDGFLGEEVGERPGTTGRRWIVDGIDGTRFFVAGARTWGTLVALEVDAEIVVGVASSPAQDRRWWAARGRGAFTGNATAKEVASATPIHVSDRRDLCPDRVATLPAPHALGDRQRVAIERLAGGRPIDRPWSHQARVAEGELDLCIWLAGDVWDHAAPSIIVEEAGGRFSDANGGTRLDTRTAVYSNGVHHEDALAIVTGA